ncbi:MAG TPA: helix-turn-helix transcriptional regulator [Puia sp.]|nr:helix-turn-helix transcriptional regulator [Puia sp.]
MRSHKTTTGAVITGDIVNSSKLLPGQERDLLEKLMYATLKDHPYEFYRGDSFQAFIDKPERSLQLALACRALAISFSERSATSFDIRISIAIGKVTLPLGNLGTNNGATFVLSGRRLDTLKEEGRRLAIISGDQKADIAFGVISNYIDSIFQKMTSRQAHVIAELLNGISQQQLAESLGKSKSTISELATAGKWPEIESLMQHFEELVKLII